MRFMRVHGRNGNPIWAPWCNEVIVTLSGSSKVVKSYRFSPPRVSKEPPMRLSVTTILHLSRLICT